jgi:hypothetical protein
VLSDLKAVKSSGYNCKLRHLSLLKCFQKTQKRPSVFQRCLTAWQIILKTNMSAGKHSGRGAGGWPNAFWVHLCEYLGLKGTKQYRSGRKIDRTCLCLHSRNFGYKNNSFALFAINSKILAVFGMCLTVRWKTPIRLAVCCKLWLRTPPLSQT